MAAHPARMAARGRPRSLGTGEPGSLDRSPLSESWRSGPGQPAWVAHEHQTRAELIANLARARRIIPAATAEVDGG
ncbi:hypothetical protein ACIBSV_36005 [Embleya sp. NPDC050154]|uniref:hypothetical protein n=1 Tax=Embleya sp. NPDC050154 TaxID=3363988 RepID=UPI0037A0DC10